MAALTRSGARNASEIVILTLRMLHLSLGDLRSVCGDLGRTTEAPVERNVSNLVAHLARAGSSSDQRFLAKMAQEQVHLSLDCRVTLKAVGGARS